MSQANSAGRKRQLKVVYILRLENENYYIGATEDLDRRMRQHSSGGGAAWTTQHPPIEVVASSSPVAHWERLEREVTIRVMARYGWTNVRGGPWTKREMESPPNDLAAGIAEVSN